MRGRVFENRALQEWGGHPAWGQLKGWSEVTWKVSRISEGRSRSVVNGPGPNEGNSAAVISTGLAAVNAFVKTWGNS